MMFGYGIGTGGWVAMLFMVLFGLLVLAGIVLLIVWASRGAPRAPMGGPPQTPSSTQALEIARQRYARGEISKEEYEDIKRTLSG